MTAKYPLIGMIVLFAIGMLTPQSYAKIDPDTIVGMWLFDEGAGDTAGDLSGNGNDGTLEGGEWVDGRFGKALEFNGAGDYVDTGDDPITDPGGTAVWSISAWVKRATDSSAMLVAIRRSPGGYVLGVGILGANTNAIKMTKYGVADIYLGDFPQDTDWHHLVGVWNEDGQIVYVDGVVNGEAGDVASFSAAAAGSLLIGGDTGDQGFADGAIDDVAVFSVDLSEDDVNDIMEKGVGMAAGLLPVSPQGRLTSVWGEIKTE